MTQPALRRRLKRLVRGQRPWDPGAILTPPAPPSGWESAPPEFVGVGVQKGGTSWWLRLIRAHPDVAVAPGCPKELHYFSRFAFEPFTPTHAAEYAGWFARPAGAIAGEWTPHYMDQAWVAPMLAQAAPSTKLLVLLRDPVDRYRSGLTLFHSHFGADARLAALSFYMSLYSEGLSAYERHFPRDQILVLQYERCCQDPAGELARTYEFLGLDPAFTPETLTRPVNQTSAEKVDLDEPTIAELVERYTPMVRDVVARYPQIDPALWPHFARLQ